MRVWGAVGYEPPIRGATLWKSLWISVSQTTRPTGCKGSCWCPRRPILRAFSPAPLEQMPLSPDRGTLIGTIWH